MQILVAGATGSLGRATAARLAASRHNVRCLTRRADPDLPGTVVRADALQDDLTEAVRGVDVVVSALGASVSSSLRERASFMDVDVPANSRLLGAAEAAGVDRFVYVGVHAAPGYADTRYARAHEAVSEMLVASPLSATTVRPVGVFTAMDEVLDMARRGRVALIGDGSARTNPVHPDDVADCIVEHLERGPEDVPIGGPEVFTRRRIAELAFEALGKPPRLTSVPAFAPRGASALARLGHPRLGDLIAFVTAVSTHHAVAPARGTRRLRDWFSERA